MPLGQKICNVLLNRFTHLINYSQYSDLRQKIKRFQQALSFHKICIQIRLCDIQTHNNYLSYIILIKARTSMITVHIYIQCWHAENLNLQILHQDLHDYEYNNYVNTKETGYMLSIGSTNLIPNYTTIWSGNPQVRHSQEESRIESPLSAIIISMTQSIANK